METTLQVSVYAKCKNTILITMVFVLVKFYEKDQEGGFSSLDPANITSGEEVGRFGKRMRSHYFVPCEAYPLNATLLDANHTISGLKAFATVNTDFYVQFPNVRRH